MSEAPILQPSFSGHESFTLRYPWLPKAIVAVKDPYVFLDDEAIVTLGVGKNMVRSIRHWGIATGVLAEGQPEGKSRTKPISASPLGKSLFGKDGFDPYLEDPGTLWLLHWELVNQPERATTWFWAFNELNDVEFTRDGLIGALQRFIDTKGWKAPSESTLSRDVECFIRTYVASHATDDGALEETLDCPFAELGLIESLGDGSTYRFAIGEQRALPDGIVGYAVLEFWERVAPNQQTITFDQLAYGVGGPGKAFKLSEDALTDYLERMSRLTNKEVTYDATAGLRQLYRRSKVDRVDLLKTYYADHNSR